MSRTSSSKASRVAQFIGRRIDKLRSRRSQLEIATLAGFKSPNMLSMIKDGKAVSPLPQGHGSKRRTLWHGGTDRRRPSRKADARDGLDAAGDRWVNKGRGAGPSVLIFDPPGRTIPRLSSQSDVAS